MPAYIGIGPSWGAFSLAAFLRDDPTVYAHVKAASLRDGDREGRLADFLGDFLGRMTAEHQIRQIVLPRNPLPRDPEQTWQAGYIVGLCRELALDYVPADRIHIVPLEAPDSVLPGLLRDKAPQGQIDAYAGKPYALRAIYCAHAARLREPVSA